MEVKSDTPRQLKVCMLLPLHYEPNRVVYSRIEILSYIALREH